MRLAVRLSILGLFRVKREQVVEVLPGRYTMRGTWTLYPDELESLQWLVTLHTRQLAECDYGEFEKAYQTTSNRVAQARAGNAPAGAIVIVGDVDARRAAA